MQIKSIKQNKYLLVFVISSFIFNSSAYSASCNKDKDEMEMQIIKYGSITSSLDGHLFTNIANLVEKNELCFADGYSYNGEIKPSFVCMIKWKKGDWGNSLVCVNQYDATHSN